MVRWSNSRRQRSTHDSSDEVERNSMARQKSETRKRCGIARRLVYFSKSLGFICIINRSKPHGCVLKSNLEIPPFQSPTSLTSKRAKVDGDWQGRLPSIIHTLGSYRWVIPERNLSNILLMFSDTHEIQYIIDIIYVRLFCSISIIHPFER